MKHKFQHMFRRLFETCFDVVKTLRFQYFCNVLECFLNVFFEMLLTCSVFAFKRTSFVKLTRVKSFANIQTFHRGEPREKLASQWFQNLGFGPMRIQKS